MKDSLACVLNGHSWEHDESKPIYLCKYCKGRADFISTLYIEGIAYDRTEVY